MADSEQRRQFETHLADILDGTADLELLELVASDDDLRDERHRVDEVRALISHAADDFVLEGAAVDQGVAVTPMIAVAPIMDVGASQSTNAVPPTTTAPVPQVAQSTNAVPPTATAPVPQVAQSGATPGPSQPTPTVPTTQPTAPALASGGAAATPRVGTIRGGVAVLIAVAVATVFGAVIYLVGPGGKKSMSFGDARPLSAKVTQLEKPSEASLVEICEGAKGACRPAEREARLEAGKLIRTNYRARAKLALGGGATVGLERATTLSLGDEDQGGLTLHAGTIVIDAGRADSAPLTVSLPLGRAELDQAKCSITADATQASVEVTRGRVKLVDQDRRESTVYAGETGRLQSGRTLSVNYNRNLGNVVAANESIGDKIDENDLSRGLGELRAKKPGETNERANAVRLTRHHVRARIVGAVAKTEIDEVFTNDTSEVLEGIFRFPLPADAQIERLALEVDGKLVDGAFTDRERAAAIWRGSIVQAAPQMRAQIRDEIIWVPGPWRDPALLEWQRGNRFELRIYPIPKQGSRRIVLSYTQVVPGTMAQRRYSYPLPQQSSDLRGVEDFALDLELRGHDPRRQPTVVGYEGKLTQESKDTLRLRVDESRFQPRGDLLVDYDLPNGDKELIAWANQPTATNEDPYVAMLLRPKLPSVSERLPKAYAFVVDTSRSMFGESLKRASALTVKMMRELSKDDRLTLLACDSECRSWPDGTLVGGDAAAESAERWLRSQTAEGASDLAASVESAIEALGRGKESAKHIVYVGDGTATAGPTRPATIAADIRRTMGAVDASITAVAVGSDSDLESLRALARGSRGVVVPYVPGTSVARAAYAALSATFGTRLAEVKLELPSGVVSVAPERLDTISAGDELLIVGRSSGPQIRGDIVLRGKVQDRPFEQRYPIDVPAVAGDSNAFVQRLYAATRIVDLERRGEESAKTEAIELSRRFSVASRYTSLLVLESQTMFDAFGLDNRRKAETWTGELEDSAKGSDAEGEEQSEKDSVSSVQAVNSGAGVEKKKASGGASDEAYEMAAPPAAPARAAAAAPAVMPAPAPKSSPAAERRESTEMVGDELSRRGHSRIAADDSLYTPPPPRRRMVPMRRIWERKGEVIVGKTHPTSATSEQVAAAERALTENPDRRSATKKLLDLYAKTGDLSRAGELAERWSERDPLDVEALVARADVAARRGDRLNAIRILGSVVDVRPSDNGAQQRLSRLYRWQGRPKNACRFATALSEFRPADEKALADALRCLGETSGVEVAQELRASAAGSVLRAAERLLEKPRATDQLSGDLRVTATWHGSDGVDVDLSLIDPDAHRVSWLGAPTRAVISATNVASRGEEGLALRGGKPGDYLLELTRGSGSGRVEGTVSVSVAGTQRQIPFSLDGARTTLGILRITTVPRLVPLDGSTAFRIKPN